MDCYENISNHFPGGLFKSVRKITLFDERPFEWDFFLKIAEAFPLIKEFSLSNRKAQNDKECRNSKDNEDLPLIKYLHLHKLDLFDVHEDYLHLFLDHTKIFFPNSISLRVDYPELKRVTDHFTQDRMRINCAKVIQLSVFGKLQISEDFKCYFPHVKPSRLFFWNKN